MRAFFYLAGIFARVAAFVAVWQLVVDPALPAAWRGNTVIMVCAYLVFVVIVSIAAGFLTALVKDIVRARKRRNHYGGTEFTLAYVVAVVDDHEKFEPQEDCYVLCLKTGKIVRALKKGVKYFWYPERPVERTFAVCRDDLTEWVYWYGRWTQIPTNLRETGSRACSCGCGYEEYYSKHVCNLKCHECLRPKALEAIRKG